MILPERIASNKGERLVPKRAIRARKSPDNENV